MMIVDAQIHIWAKGTPSAHHRQEPFSKDQALAGMDEAGVDRAVIHPPMWDPDSNELAVEAVRAHPDRFAILGWFPLDRPESRALLPTWKNRPGMLGLRFYFNQPHEQSWPTDGTLDWLWPAAERAGVPVALAAAAFLPVVGRIAERHPRLKLIVDHMGVPRATRGEASYRNLPQLIALARHPNIAVRPRDRRATPWTSTRSAAFTRICARFTMPSGHNGCSGERTSPACRARGGNASRCSPRRCLGWPETTSSW